MIDSLKGRVSTLKWRPRQKFVVTEPGRAAREDYAGLIMKLQRGEGARDALAHLQRDWASRFHVQPIDSTVLTELGDQPKLHRQILDGLAEAGLTLGDVQDSVDRLYSAGLVAPADGIPPEIRGHA